MRKQILGLALRYQGEWEKITEGLKQGEKPFCPEIAVPYVTWADAEYPALLRQLLGGPALSASELEEFLGRLADEYGHVLSGERDVLFKMKELWFYLIRLFPDSSRQLKQIRKAQRLTEYEAAVASLLSDWEGVPKTGKGRLHDGGEEEEKGDGAV